MILFTISLIFTLNSRLTEANKLRFVVDIVQVVASSFGFSTIVPRRLRSAGVSFCPNSRMSPMVASSSKPRVVFFVDGFNLYHSVKEAERQLPDKQLKWLDIPSLCASYLHQVGGGAELAEVHYFTAYAENLKEKNPEKLIRHKAIVRALTSPKVVAHISKFSRKHVWSDELEC